ncbi:MAG: transglutaminase domain-containing protein, partial [Rubripirellula sp.]
TGIQQRLTLWLHRHFGYNSILVRTHPPLKKENALKASYLDFHRVRLIVLLIGLGLVSDLGVPTAVVGADETTQTSIDLLESRLALAEDNRGQLEQALKQVVPEQLGAMRFLIENMPKEDLQNLTAAFLVEHVQLAFTSRAEAKWGSDIPEEVFLNEVLPYSNVNEKRDNVRRELREKFWPIVKDLDSISLAAARLNQEVFKQLNVKYSTQRRRADQGPRETIETGLASCTGLTVLYIDACRACGIPTRFAGTPLWSDGSGNHSWAEVWDSGWHFTGAAEPTGDELDQGWFVDRASKAQANSKHAIYAVSFKRTEQKFPLVWLRGEHEISAIDVTSRYARPQKAIAGLIDVRFRALNADQRDRCQANLLVRDEEGKIVFRGLTKDERFDANDHLSAKLSPGNYTAELRTPEGIVTTKFVAASEENLISVVVEDPQPMAAALRELQDYCKTLQATTPEELASVSEQAFATVALSRSEAEQAADMLSNRYQELMEQARRKEHDEKRIVIGEREMKYATTTFGDEPASGRSLVISMHGGGGAPKRVNDQQWENQKRLYELKEGIYVAPRAPTDTWNLWHESHIDVFFTRIIANMIAFENVDPNRVYITGYSAGGDGVYQLAPRMADQLAAAAMMAGHPNETQPLGLRNLPFTLHVGGNDAAYDRNKIAQQWKESLAKLHEEDPQGYTHWAKVHEGKGHWMDRDDREGVQWMSQYERSLTPEKVVWLQDDTTHDRFYWLAVKPNTAKARAKVIATRDGNHIAIEHCDPSELTLLLRDDMFDFTEPLRVTVKEQEVFNGPVKRTIADIARTLVDRGDPQAVFTASVAIEIPTAADGTE